jgi:hypothetical protein
MTFPCYVSGCSGHADYDALLAHEKYVMRHRPDVVAIEALMLSFRAMRILKECGCSTVMHAMQAPEEILRMKHGCGVKTLAEIRVVKERIGGMGKLE